MSANGGLTCIAVALLLAVVCHAAMGAGSDNVLATSQANTVNASDDTASIPDFDGDGTVGFGDFVKFAGKFGLSESDDGYDALYDLNGDGSIGFVDFLILAENFGREAPSPVVSIPDTNLRAAIEAALGKDSGAPITKTEMATLDTLKADNADISDLTGLETAVNLTWLSLNDNDINDISALASLINLERLWLSNNGIEDISALAKLTGLTELWLWNNRVEDVSALSGLTGLTRLSLGRNNLTDVSALSELINLSMLILKSNRISDLSPLAENKGLTRGVAVDVTGNPLDAASEGTHVPALQARGVAVSFVPSPVTWKIAEDVPPRYGVQLQQEMRRVQWWFSRQYDVETPSFTVLIGISLRTFGPLYEEVVGRELQYISGAWVEYPDDPVMVLMFGDFNEMSEKGYTAPDDTTEAAYLFNRFLSLRTIIAHEYFHVLQHNLSNSNGGAWWLIEATASYADLVYTEANPQGRRPFLSLPANDGRYTPFEDLRWFAQNTEWRQRRGLNEVPYSVELKLLEQHYSTTDYPHLYAYALAFVAFIGLMEHADDDAYVNYWKLLGEKDTWQDAFQEAFDTTPDEIYKMLDTWIPRKLRDTGR